LKVKVVVLQRFSVRLLCARCVLVAPTNDNPLALEQGVASSASPPTNDRITQHAHQSRKCLNLIYNLIFLTKQP